MRNKILFVVFLIFLLALFPRLSRAASDASLYLSPASKAVLAGQNFSVAVFVSSAGALNAAEGKIIFSADRLEAVGISKAGSIFVIWPEEPSYSNQDGAIGFAGGMPSPGYAGEAGKIITITFRAKSAGPADVKFESGAILADDGRGTNLLSVLGNGKYNIQAAVLPAPKAPPALYAPELPVVQIEMRKSVADEWLRYSEGFWSRFADFRFSWKIPQDVIAMAYEFDSRLDTDPQAVYDKLLEEAVSNNVKDGIWFFHIKFKNKNGWSKTVHKEVQIDTKPPYGLEVKIDNGGDETNPRPQLIFSAADDFSGVDCFEIKIDEGNFQTAEGNKFITSVLSAGRHNLFILAEDKAGNRALKMETIEIKSIEPPETIGIIKIFLAIMAILVLALGAYASAVIKRSRQKKSRKNFLSKLLKF